MGSKGEKEGVELWLLYVKEDKGRPGVTAAPVAPVRRKLTQQNLQLKSSLRCIRRAGIRKEAGTKAGWKG